MRRTSHGHELVRSHLRELDAAVRGVPAAQARELKDGQRQGFLVNVCNPTGVTQTILGPDTAC